MKLSISEAARRAGVRRMTIYRKLEAGKLSKETDNDGNTVIDLAELARVYPHAVTAPGRNPETRRDALETGAETAVLRELIAVLQQDKERLTAELDRARVEAREERARLLGLLEMAQRQLADLREKPKEEEPKERRHGWFGRLLRV